MTMKLEQAARQALEALETLDCGDSYKTHNAASALQKALAEQEDEIDWIETNKALAKEIIELKKQAEQSQLADASLEPVARVSGYYGGRCVVEPLNRATVLPTDMALYAAPVQQVTRADLKAAFKEGFERAADLYAPNDGQEPYAYEVWDVQDQSFTMIYATQLKEFHWIEPENIARVLYAAPVRTKDLTDDELADIVYEMNGNEPTAPFWRDLARAVIAADREKDGGGA